MLHCKDNSGHLVEKIILIEKTLYEQNLFDIIAFSMVAMYPQKDGHRFSYAM